MSWGKGNGIKKGVKRERKAKLLDIKCCLVGKKSFSFFLLPLFHHSTTTSSSLIVSPPPSPHLVVPRVATPSASSFRRASFSPSHRVTQPCTSPCMRRLLSLPLPLPASPPLAPPPLLAVVTCWRGGDNALCGGWPGWSDAGGWVRVLVVVLGLSAVRWWRLGDGRLSRWRSLVVVMIGLGCDGLVVVVG